MLRVVVGVEERSNERRISCQESWLSGQLESERVSLSAGAVLGKKGKWRAQVVAFIPGLVSQKPALCQLSARLLLAHFNPARPHAPPHDPPGPTRQRTPSRLVAQHRAQASVMLGGRTERKQNTQKVKLLAGAVSARAVLVQTPGVAGGVPTTVGVAHTATDRPGNIRSGCVGIGGAGGLVLVERRPRPPRPNTLQ